MRHTWGYVRASAVLTMTSDGSLDLCGHSNCSTRDSHSFRASLAVRVRLSDEVDCSAEIVSQRALHPASRRLFSTSHTSKWPRTVHTMYYKLHERCCQHIGAQKMRCGLAVDQDMLGASLL